MYKGLVGALVEVCTDQTEEQIVQSPDTEDTHNLMARISYTGYFIGHDKETISLGYYVAKVPFCLMVIERKHVIGVRVVKEETPQERSKPVLQ